MQPKDFSKKRFKLIPGEDYENGPISEHGTFGNMLKNKIRTRNQQMADSIPGGFGAEGKWDGQIDDKFIEGITDSVNPVMGTTLLGRKYAKLMGQGELDKLITARKRQAAGDNIQQIEKDTGMLFSQGRMKYPVRDFNDRVSFYGIENDKSYKLSDVYKKKDKDEVFIAYPELKNITMRIHNEKGGSYAPDIKKIYTSKDKGTLAHEGMHGIQSTYNLPSKGSAPAIEALDNADIVEILNLKYGIDPERMAVGLQDPKELIRLSKEYKMPLTNLSPFNRYKANPGEIESDLAMEVSPKNIFMEDGVRNSKPEFTGFKSIDDGIKLQKEIQNYLDNGWGELYD